MLTERSNPLTYIIRKNNIADPMTNQINEMKDNYTS